MVFSYLTMCETFTKTLGVQGLIPHFERGIIMQRMTCLHLNLVSRMLPGFLGELLTKLREERSGGMSCECPDPGSRERVSVAVNYNPNLLD